MFKRFLLISVIFLNSMAFGLPKNIEDTLKELSLSDCKIYKTDSYTSCFSAVYNRASFVEYKVDARSSEGNIKTRPRFYNNPDINVVNNNDYMAIKEYDRGHLAFHAAFDYSKESLEPLYDLELNIVPMLKNVNRIHNRHIERNILNAARVNDVNVVMILIPSGVNLNGGNVNIPSKIITAVTIKDATTCYILDNLMEDHNHKPYEYDCSMISYLRVL